MGSRPRWEGQVQVRWGQRPWDGHGGRGNEGNTVLDLGSSQLRGETDAAWVPRALPGRSGLCFRGTEVLVPGIEPDLWVHGINLERCLSGV